MKLKLCASIALAVMASTAAVQAQEAYVIGMSTALTGPGASTVAGAAEGLKLYVERLNKAGGINGRTYCLT
ncbi:MAG: ABC transporter substrate-binding protein [Pseudolabrys sp.]